MAETDTDTDTVTFFEFFSSTNCASQGAAVVAVIIIQAIFLIALSNLIHFFLKPLGQPAVVSQMIAGVFLGPTGISGLDLLKNTLFAARESNFLTSAAAVGRVFFMFLTGLEMDIPYIRRSAYRASMTAYGGLLLCVVTGLASSPIIRRLIGDESLDANVKNKNHYLLTAVLALIFANTAAPVLIRMATELKLSNSEVGRLAISAALINDVTCLLLVSVASSFEGDGSLGDKIMLGLKAGLVLVASAAAVRPAVRWLNRRNRQRRHVRNWEAGGVMLVVLGVSAVTEMMGYNSMMASFIMGLLFPREGSTTRTLEDKLTFPVNYFFLPIYFGYTGSQVSLGSLLNARLLTTAGTIVVLSTAAKVAGTVLTTAFLKIGFHEGLVLGFLLNVKGHVDLIILTFARRVGIGEHAYKVLLVTVVVNTLVAGPVAALVVRLERKALRYRSTALQWREVNSELRVVACVHSPQDVPTMLNLIELSTGGGRVPLAAYVLHLIELTRRLTTRMLYNQVHLGSADNDEWDFIGGDKSRQIVLAADAFRAETGLGIRLVSAISSLPEMHMDVCNGVEDVRATFLLLPFHKHQLVDGRMGGTRGGVRKVNLKVLRYAPCTVGILVDRGLGAVQAAGPEAVHQVVVLFFGGPDDREAVAFGSRIALDPSVSLSVVRFLPASGKEYSQAIEMEVSKDDDILQLISDHEKESKEDEAFLSEFFSRDVVSGSVTYLERYVENSAETVTALSSMVGMYSLYLVGRGKRVLSPLTIGMSDWEQCPELGAIGDLLASSDFMTDGSVLVLQQFSQSDYVQFENGDNEFMRM